MLGAVPWPLWSPCQVSLNVEFLPASQQLSLCKVSRPLGTSGAPAQALPHACPPAVLGPCSGPTGMSLTGLRGSPASADHIVCDTIAMRLLGGVLVCRPWWTSSLSNYAAVSRWATRLGTASSLCVSSGPVTHQRGCTCLKLESVPVCLHVHLCVHMPVCLCVHIHMHGCGWPGGFQPL